MSVKVMARVWEHSRQKGTALLLALAIADYCNDEAWAWPSVASLRRKTRLRSDRTVHGLLRKLESDGEIAIERGAGLVNTTGGSQRTNRYRVLVGLEEGGAKSAPPCQRKGGAKTAQGGAFPRKGGAIATAPDPSANPSIDPSSRGHQFPSDMDKTPGQRAANIHRLAQMASELVRKKQGDAAETRPPRK